VHATFIAERLVHQATENYQRLVNLIYIIIEIHGVDYV